MATNVYYADEKYYATMGGETREFARNDKMQELGSPGLSRWGGYISEEPLPELRGLKAYRIYDEMRRNEAAVAGFLFAIEMVLRQMPWQVEPGGDTEADKRAAEFLESCLDDMSHTWADTIVDILTMLPFGFAPMEIVMKLRRGPTADPPSAHDDRRIGLRKLVLLGQDTVSKWLLDDYGGIQGLEQQAITQQGPVEIPIEKMILFRTKREKNNPEGYSVLRNSYHAWYMKREMEKMEGILLERGGGMPVVKLPPGHTATDRTEATKLVRRIRVDEQMGVVEPPGWEFRFERPPGAIQGKGFHEAILRYRSDILMSVMATFLALGTEKVGSYALHRDEVDLFQVALGGWARGIEETLNRHLVPKLFAVNSFPGMTALPQLQHGKIGRISLATIADFMSKLLPIGALTWDEGLEDWLRDVAELPGRPQEHVRVAPWRVMTQEPWAPTLKNKPTTLKEIRDIEERLGRDVRKLMGELGDELQERWEG